MRVNFRLLLLPLGALLCCFPFVSTGLGLLLGLSLALTAGNPSLERTRKLTPKLLAFAVVGLGAGMDLRVVARVGAQGVLYTIAGISLALALGAALTRLLGVGRVVGFGYTNELVEVQSMSPLVYASLLHP